MFAASESAPRLYYASQCTYVNSLCHYTLSTNINLCHVYSVNSNTDRHHETVDIFKSHNTQWTQ